MSECRLTGKFTKIFNVRFNDDNLTKLSTRLI